MTGRLQETLDNYLLYHLIEGSSKATVKSYAKEVRLFLQDLDPTRQTLADLSPFHVLGHLGSMKDRWAGGMDGPHPVAGHHHLAQLVCYLGTH